MTFSLEKEERRSPSGAPDNHSLQEARKIGLQWVLSSRRQENSHLAQTLVGIVKRILSLPISFSNHIWKFVLTPFQLLDTFGSMSLKILGESTETSEEEQISSNKTERELTLKVDPLIDNKMIRKRYLIGQIKEIG